MNRAQKPIFVKTMKIAVSKLKKENGCLGLVRIKFTSKHLKLKTILRQNVIGFQYTDLDQDNKKGMPTSVIDFSAQFDR